MENSSRGHRLASQQYQRSPHQLPSYNHKVLENSVHQNNECPKALDKKDWEDAFCSVCMEYPHNAVLLLCSSHDKGCYPYMCATSYRYSNCLDQYKKAYTKVRSPNHEQLLYESADNSNVGSGSCWPSKKREVTELACPLCRGQVKGWTVVEPARKYLNTKKRSCMQDDCSFVGTYKKLRKHVRAEHPFARPRKVDPMLEQKWTRLEHEREREDVISTIRSSMPGAIVVGDYVIERNHRGFNTNDGTNAANRDGGIEGGLNENWLNDFLRRQALGPARNVGLSSRMRMRNNINSRLRRLERAYHFMLDEAGIHHGTGAADGASGVDDAYGHYDDDSTNDDMPHVDRSRGRLPMDRSRRRRRRREATRGP